LRERETGDALYIAVSDFMSASDDSSNGASSSDSELEELAGVDAMDLRVQSRNLSG
jgi:hypothetical protein